MNIRMINQRVLSPRVLVDGRFDLKRAEGCLDIAVPGKPARCELVYQFQYDGEDCRYRLCDADGQQLTWLDHDDSMTYVPFAFSVMNWMSCGLSSWQGGLHTRPSSDSDVSKSALMSSVEPISLTVLESCVSVEDGLWIMVAVSTSQAVSGASRVGRACDTHCVRGRLLGWLPAGDLVARPPVNSTPDKPCTVARTPHSAVSAATTEPDPTDVVSSPLAVAC